MIDDKKYDPCEPEKNEEENCTDDRIRMQVDDKLIGDDKLVASLKPPVENTQTGKDAVY